MNAAQELSKWFEKARRRRLETPIVYRVKHGDTFSQIIARYYDVSYLDSRYKLAEAAVLYSNPEIKHPDQIHPGQMIFLTPLFDLELAQCQVPEGYFETLKKEPQRDLFATLPRVKHHLEPVGHSYLKRFQRMVPTDPKEEEAFWALSWLQQNYDFLSVSAGSGLNTWGGLTSQANNTLIRQVKVDYQHYKNGLISKGAYDGRRKKVLNTYARKLGPFEKVMFKGQTTHEAIRIQRTKALPATANIDRHLSRLQRMSNLAKYGGVVLTAAGVGMGCYNIAQTQSREEKNEIFVETIAGALAGGFSSYLLGVIFVSNPVGWGLALVLGTAATFASYGSGKAAAKIYNNLGSEFDLISMSKIDRLCD